MTATTRTTMTALLRQAARDRRPNRAAAGTAAAVAALVLLALVPAPAGAQDAAGQSPFNLYASRDFAATGMRAGTNHRIWLSNAGVFDAQQQMRGLLGLQVKKGSTFYSQLREMTLWAATGPKDYNAARAANPSLASARGDGYAVSFNINLTPEHLSWAAKDGALGFLHRGVRTPAPGQQAAACLNHAADGLSAGVTLMAGSDCPDTWGLDGWVGDRPVAFSTWKTFQAQHGSNFRFDFWAVPDALKEDGFLGNNFQTFGVISDYGREVRERFGSVVQHGSGAPQEAGFPLGLEWTFNAFNVKGLPGVVFWQATVTNRSNDIYGRGIDYTDLRLGFLLRDHDIRSRAGYDPARGAVVMNNPGRTENCDSARAVMPGWGGSDTFNGTCSGANSARNGTEGFIQGGTAVVFLKSPIGDLRNKLFSTPGTAFYSPGNTASGDTITFNIGRACGEPCTGDQFMVDRPRRAYGVLASNEADALDGRLPTSLAPLDYFNLFHPANGYHYGDGPAVDLANPRAGGGFNYAVPGTWDGSWNGTGSADTLFLDTCSPTRNECVGVYVDTLPDRTLNFVWRNVWVGTGPIRLPVGATTSFIVAVTAQPDSATLDRSIDDAIRLYQSFFVAPAPPPAPRVVAADVRVVGETTSPRVTFTLDMRPARYTDPYLELLANDIRNAKAGTPAAELRDLNPWLPDSLLARAKAPVRRILVFKSCNPAATTLVYTTSRSASVCERSVQRDSLGADKGPAAYSQITRLTDVTYADSYVGAGQSYLYAFVPETYGAAWAITKRKADGTTFTKDTVFAAPTAELPTTRAQPNVAVVYVPASRQAGGSGARIDYVTETGGNTIVTEVVPELGGTSNPLEGSWGDISPSVVDSVSRSESYRVLIGDTIVVRDFGPVGSPQIDSTEVRVVRSVVTGYTFGGSATARTATAARTPFEVLGFKARKQGGIPVHSTATLGASTTVEGGTRVDTRRLVGPAGVLLHGAMNRPLFASNVTVSNQPFTPPAFLASPDYTGVAVSVLNRTSAPATYRMQFFLDQDGVRLNPVVSSLNPINLAWITAGSLASRGIGTGHGEYALFFADREFGPGAPFRSSEGVQGLNAAVAASLQAREEAARTDASAATADAISRALGLAITEADLASVSLPFSVRNNSYDRAVTVAMLKADKVTTALWGTGPDTFRVSLPEGHWVPGDRLIFLEDVDVATVSGGQVSRGTERQVTFAPARLGCGTSTTTVTCNPIAGRGQSGHVPIERGYTMVVRYALPLTSDKELRFDVLGARSGSSIAGFGQAQLDSVKVVPNPYILYSSFEQQSGGSARVMFTHMPPQGTLRIYTVSGILVQEIRWTEQDLQGAGDLFFDLRTREGTEMASGLYLFTVVAKDPATGAERKKLGRFIIIR